MTNRRRARPAALASLASMASLAALLLLLTAACATPLETVRLDLDEGDRWVVGHAQDFGSGRGTIVEWIRPGDSIDDWEELVTVQFLEGSPLSPERGVAALEEDLRRRCPDVRWEILTEALFAVTYEWSISGCEGQDDQHELARLLQGNEGLHRVAYTRKGPRLDAETRERWLERLTAAFVVYGEDQQPVILGLEPEE